MAEQIDILIIEDNKGDYILVREMLASREAGRSAKTNDFNLVWADRLTAGLQLLSKQRFDCILLDLSLPDAHGLDGFYIVRAVASNIPILVLTGYDDQNAALNAVHAGAQDYLVKGKLDSNIITRAVDYAIERSHILSDLETAKEAAERADKAKSDFLLAVIDEVAPAMKSIVRVAKSFLDENLDLEHHERVEALKGTAHNVIKLLNNISDFSQIEGTNCELKAVEFKLRDYTAQVLAMLELKANESGVELSYKIGHSVPNRLVGDPERFGQVITNLIENAIRFGKSDRRMSRKVELSCETGTISNDETTLNFTVSVAHGGIPIEEQRLIFESFAQADASSLRKYGSTGMSLAVSSKLVELMGGRAWVETENEKGTEFHFTIQFGLPVLKKLETPELPKKDVEQPTGN